MIGAYSSSVLAQVLAQQLLMLEFLLITLQQEVLT
jgi:hypothetical protein